MGEIAPVSPAELNALADRVEALTGADREVDLAILNATQAKAYRWAEFGGMYPDQRDIVVEVMPEWVERIEASGDSILFRGWEPDIRKCPSPTASLDAAVSLWPGEVPDLIPSNPRKAAAAALRSRARAAEGEAG